MINVVDGESTGIADYGTTVQNKHCFADLVVHALDLPVLVVFDPSKRSKIDIEFDACHQRREPRKQRFDARVEAWERESECVVAAQDLQYFELNRLAELHDAEVMLGVVKGSYIYYTICGGDGVGRLVWSKVCVDEVANLARK